MALTEFIFGRNPALEEAERALRMQEDRVFQLADGEDHDLATHVRADIPRFEALNARQRLGQALTAQSSNRNLTFQAIGFTVLFAKIFGAFDLVLKVIGIL